MTDAERLAFCRAARLLIEAIRAGHIEPRERDDLAFQLARVHQYSGVAPRPDDQLRWVCEIHMDLRDAGGGWVELDVAALDAAVDSQRESHRAFDLVAYPPDAPSVAQHSYSPLHHHSRSQQTPSEPLGHSTFLEPPPCRPGRDSPTVQRRRPPRQLPQWYHLG
jgi:hypothetical protein